ncbi:MAG: CDP-alcohol phosphatidyltransferase family protein [Planctomycetota bacterium]
MRSIYLLPNLITLANAFCGLLALAKAIDALAYAPTDEAIFYAKMETACLLVFLGMVFDTLDGFVARVTRTSSSFGAQLDSYADALTFGVTPALLAKVLIEHEGALTGLPGNPRVHFLAAAAFALMAILRLVRFNLEGDENHDDRFAGLPSPGAAGAVAATIWLYLVLRRPELETADGTPTPFGRMMGWMEGVDWTPFLDFVPSMLVGLLPVLGLLMVSRVPYGHFGQFLLRGRGSFISLVGIVFGAFAFFLAPVPALFVGFNLFVLAGPCGLFRRRGLREEEAPA